MSEVEGEMLWRSLERCHERMLEVMKEFGGLMAKVDGLSGSVEELGRIQVEQKGRIEELEREVRGMKEREENRQKVEIQLMGCEARRRMNLDEEMKGICDRVGKLERVGR